MNQEEVNVVLNCLASMAHSLSNISERLDQMAGDEEEDDGFTLDGEQMGGERDQNIPL